ncbi:uncharacterized protein SCHCODRAFT_01206404 [Schizophyllum commune H4-8]|uniref:uncharacterized protein n=1 Tax=Schizophyllum commune (strain H4-8 / FGSC 9210) TaxID=578458 RepID=UPI002160123C|nr:uncharacterized protein SCHCODRAFT_01206404 [Schizophyllum commune H4-8]KAI5886283.1 hypothetical protein SCHCODRAFT_01206404 [Schizophyllum commune H4-8]
MGEGSLRRASKSPTKVARGGESPRREPSRRAADPSASPSTSRIGRSAHRAPLPSTSSPRRLPSSSSSPRKLPSSASSRIPQAPSGIPPVPPLPNLPSLAGIPSLGDIPLNVQGPRSPPVPPHTPHERAVPVPILRVPSTEGPVKMFYAASVISMSTVDGEEGVVGDKGEEGGKGEEEKKWLCDEVEEEGLEQEETSGHEAEGRVHDVYDVHGREEAREADGEESEVEEGADPAGAEAASSPEVSPSPPASPVLQAASSPSPSTPTARSRPPSIASPSTPDAKPEAKSPSSSLHQHPSRSPSPQMALTLPPTVPSMAQASAEGASSPAPVTAASEAIASTDDASSSTLPPFALLPPKTGPSSPHRHEQNIAAAADAGSSAHSSAGDAAGLDEAQALAAEHDDHNAHLSDTGRRIGRITVPPWLEGSVPSRDPRIRAEVEALRKAAKVGRVKGAKEA